MNSQSIPSQSPGSKQRIEWLDGLLLGATLLLFMNGLGSYGLFEPHEGHFAGVAREMVLRGDWITPTLDGAPYLNKPPLLYWLIATSFTAFGIQEFAARLPAALAGWIGVVIAWRWSWQLWGAVAGRAAAVFLGTSVGWFIFAHQLLIDEVLGTILLAMMYCLWHLLQDPKSRTYFVAVYLLLGLAILAKGILALAFWIVTCACVGLMRQSCRAVRLLKPGLGLCTVGVMVLPWFVAVERANPGFVEYFLLNEHIKRALDTRWPPDYSISTVGVMEYLLITAVWCIPWLLLLPPALAETWRCARASLNRQSGEQSYQDALMLLTVLAAFPILLFLPLSSRLYYYTIPALPPLAMLAGRWWATLANGKAERTRIGLGWGMSTFGAAIATSFIGLPKIIVSSFPELSQTDGVETMVRAILAGLSVGFLGTGLSLLRRKMATALVLLWLGFGTSWACVVQGFNTVQDFRSSKTIILKAQQHLKPQTLWIFEGSRELGAAGAMSFYLHPNGVQLSQAQLSQTLTAQPKESAPKQLFPKRILERKDWVRGKPGTVYQTVLVLTDGGPNRLPPDFPGPQPSILISKVQMQQDWVSNRPVVFVTDFLRVPQDPKDPLNLNLPPDAGVPLIEIGPRKLYGNAIARKLWLQ